MLAAAALVVVVAVVAAATTIAIAATRSDGSSPSSAPRRPRVALVVPGSPPGSDDPSAQYVDAFERWRTQDGLSTQVLQIDLSKPGLSGLSGSARHGIGTYGLVLLAGQFVGNRFVREFSRHPHTRFVVLDPTPINEQPLYDAVSRNRNTSDVFFIEGPGAYLAGFLGALMAERRSSGERPAVVSEILVDRQVSANVVDTFRSGATDAVPGVKVLEHYAGRFSPPSACETIATHQVEQGSLVVYADAGACSPGALSAAETLGVWGIAADVDPSHPDVGPQILGYTVKNFGQEVDSSVRSYLDHTLQPGHFDLGIQVGAVDFVRSNPVVPELIRARLEQARQKHMKHWSTLGEP
jgi:basic membrane lipoprotein Med (substrate-binding protein (PBP1-ABC) superfamily)